MAKFIVFEGVDRCGKSTQIKKVSEWLTRIGIENIVIQEPGTTTLGLFSIIAERFLYDLSKSTLPLKPKTSQSALSTNVYPRYSAINFAFKYSPREAA